jgi:hypothetical protein
MSLPQSTNHLSEENVEVVAEENLFKRRDAFKSPHLSV